MGTKGQAGRHTHTIRAQGCATVCALPCCGGCVQSAHTGTMLVQAIRWKGRTCGTVQSTHTRTMLVQAIRYTKHATLHRPTASVARGAQAESCKATPHCRAHTACRNATSQTGNRRCHSHWQLGVAVCCRQGWWPHLAPRWYKGLGGTQL